MRAIVEYDGRNYAGFQVQPNRPSIQSVLEAAIAGAAGTESRVIAAGRTDAGAHALGQITGFRTETGLDDRRLRGAINAHLPRDIAVRDLQTVQEPFHPRFDAKTREYRYLILNRSIPSPHWRGRALHVPYPLDVVAMRSAAKSLLGRHDFAAFGTPETSTEARNAGFVRSSTREIYRVSIDRAGECIAVHLVGNAFMKHMIRTIVGTLLRVGSGRMSAGEFERVLRAKDRRLAGPTAPADGLYLVEVTY